MKVNHLEVLKNLMESASIYDKLFSFTLSLQIIDEDETQFMTNCPHAVTESTPRRRNNIQVFWTAPPIGSGCILLKYVHMLNQSEGSSLSKSLQIHTSTK